MKHQHHIKPTFHGLIAAESVLIRGIHASGGENERLERAAKWVRQEIVRLYAK